jgi:selenocysteine lyase/cysteine desulfurase
MTPDQVVERLAASRIVSTSSPYQVSYARLTPALFNTPADLDAALRAIRALA